MAGARPTTGRSDLNRTNPEISFTGDLLGSPRVGAGSGAGPAGTDTRDEFNAREFELDFQSALDPYSRTRWTLAFSPEGTVDVEEGYVTYNALPGGLGLNLGKFRQQFGVLNRQHAHALPQTDYPLVLRSFFGDEGLAETGVSARWLLPHPWATANELTLEVTDGENEAFGGQNFQDFAGLAHLKNYWDLSAAAYFEWGLTATAGKSADGGGHQIYGTDLTVHWQPPARAKYREFTWRTELLLSDLALPERRQRPGLGRLHLRRGVDRPEPLRRRPPGLVGGPARSQSPDLGGGALPDLVGERVRAHPRRVPPHRRPDHRPFGRPLHLAAHLGRGAAQA